MTAVTLATVVLQITYAFALVFGLHEATLPRRREISGKWLLLLAFELEPKI